MKTSLTLLGAALGLALLVSGCETDSSSSRIQEKSAVYASLKPWQKRNIDNGVPAIGFSPDMVYMAIGNPSLKKDTAEGELWTYKNYYPSTGADKVRFTLTTEKGMDHNIIGGMLTENTGGPGTSSRPAGSSKGGTGQSISQTGGPQGGSMEPADITSYTLYVAFQKGVVSQMRLDPN